MPSGCEPVDRKHRWIPNQETDLAAQLTPQTLVARDPDHVSTEIDDRTVILSISKGQYCELNPTGSLIWAELACAKTVSALCDDMGQRFDVDPATCQAEVSRFLGQMVDQGLLSIQHAA
jgi:hypothetical protein